jgi:Golgi nucleoside diphosphatase
MKKHFTLRYQYLNKLPGHEGLNAQTFEEATVEDLHKAIDQLLNKPADCYEFDTLVIRYEAFDLVEPLS